MGVLTILNAAPHLQQLSFSGNELVRFEASMIPGISVLKQRMLQGFKFDASIVWLRGSSLELLYVVAALPVLPRVHGCLLQYHGMQAPHPSTRLGGVFPDLSEIQIDCCQTPSNPGPNLEQLGCLTTCSSLKKLRIRGNLNLTIPELVDLWGRIPTLESVGSVKQRANHLQLPSINVFQHGRFMQIREFSNVDHKVFWK